MASKRLDYQAAARERHHCLLVRLRLVISEACAQTTTHTPPSTYHRPRVQPPYVRIFPCLSHMARTIFSKTSTRNMLGKLARCWCNSFHASSRAHELTSATFCCFLARTKHGPRSDPIPSFLGGVEGKTKGLPASFVFLWFSHAFCFIFFPSGVLK
jgi:hypothetical protein